MDRNRSWARKPLKTYGRTDIPELFETCPSVKKKKKKEKNCKWLGSLELDSHVRTESGQLIALLAAQSLMETAVDEHLDVVRPAASKSHWAD